jgi:hypothetical protein
VRLHDPGQQGGRHLLELIQIDRSRDGATKPQRRSLSRSQQVDLFDHAHQAAIERNDGKVPHAVTFTHSPKASAAAVAAAPMLTLCVVCMGLAATALISLRRRNLALPAWRSPMARLEDSTVIARPVRLSPITTIR